MSDDHEGGDSLAGSGLTADDYGEESWADERSPWDTQSDDPATDKGG